MGQAHTRIGARVGWPSVAIFRGLSTLSGAPLQEAELLLAKARYSRYVPISWSGAESLASKSLAAPPVCLRIETCFASGCMIPVVPVNTICLAIEGPAFAPYRQKLNVNFTPFS